MEKVKVGIVGCGNISEIYFTNLNTIFKITEVVACCDVVPERAQEKAEKFGCKAMSLDEMLKDKEIKIIVNLTTPPFHFDICLKALNAGKNTYTEKPLSVTIEQGKILVQTAKEKGLLLGCAPETFLGAGIQTCAKLINDGWIGKPVAATAFMTGHGPEGWHPDPEFFYQVGGGPMFDMGPYYLTALVNLLGPVKRVTGSAKISFPTRTITSEKKFGKEVNVEIPTHIAGIIDFKSGAVGTIITSFDVWSANLPRIEIYGSEGTLSVPDPNTFGGPVKLLRMGSNEWGEIPLSHSYAENSRGIGVADMAYALQSGRHHRASGELANHVLEIMHGFHIASNTGRHYKLKSNCKRPATLPTGLIKGMLDK